jgi:signal transduction histidine kinase
LTNESRPRQLGETLEPWRTAIVAVGGLLLAVIVAGIVGLVLNDRLQSVAGEALEYDVDVEDEGDDLQVEVLNLRNLHRVLMSVGPSRASVGDLEISYERLVEEIGELEELGVREPEAPRPAEIRALAEAYYDEFRSALLEYNQDDPEFIEAADQGLVRLEQLEEHARQIDELGEVLAERSLQSVDNTAETTALVLIAVIAGLVLVGGGLAFAAVRVVGELRQLYRSQAEATRALEEAARVRSDFLADVSHELRTPLSVLRGNAELAATLSDDDSKAEALKDVMRESIRISRLVDDLLFLSRAESTTLPLNKERLSLEPFLVELVERARALATKRGVELVHEIDVEGEIEADPQRVEQAVLIFVDNATKFSPPDRHVTVQASSADGRLCIAVMDQGPGIAPEHLPHVFERAYQARRTDDGPEGSGLGLAIADRISALHGGEIRIESTPGAGTNVRLYLPMLPAEAAIVARKD